MRPSEDPPQDARGQDDAQPEGEQVPGADRQGEGDDHVPHVVPAAEGERGTPEQDGAGEHPAEALDQQRVGDEGGSDEADGAPVGAAAELDVLTALGLTAAAAQHVDGEEDAHDEQQAAHDHGDCGGADGAAGDPAFGQEQRLDDDEETQRPEEHGHSELGAALLLGAAGGGGTHARPSSLRTDSTRLFSSLRKLSKSSPVRKASVQPWSSRTFFHASLSCISVTASTTRCFSSSEISGAATMPRQLVKVRSTPSSVSVGASTPSTGSALVTARMRTSPDAADSVTSLIPVAANAMSPPRMPASSSPPPSYAT